MQYTALHFYRPQAQIRASGEDVFTFLQGQFTNQLQLPAGSAVYGLWLNQKGKVLADSFALRTGANEFYLTSISSSAVTIRERLEAYIIADDVVLDDETSSVGGLAVIGAGSSEVMTRLLGQCPASGQFLRIGDVMIFSGRRAVGPSYELIGPPEALAAHGRQLVEWGAVAIDAEAVEALRIEAGIPAIPEDIGAGDLPNEGALEGVAISYTKGCYLGQEVMARLKNLGQVRRKLHVVRGAGEPPLPLAPLYQGTEKIGELRSVAKRGDGFAGMAMLSLVKLKRDAALSVLPETVPTVEVVSHG